MKCDACGGIGNLKDGFDRGYQCTQCYSNNVLIEWYRHTPHFIYLKLNNKSHDIDGELISKGGDCFLFSGKDEMEVLRTLKDMVDGNYKK